MSVLLYWLKLRSFGVSASLLAIFYNAVVCSALKFGVVCWGGNISKHEWGRLEKIVKNKAPISEYFKEVPGTLLQLLEGPWAVLKGQV